MFPLSRTTPKTITASTSTPTVIASAVAACRARLCVRILLGFGATSFIRPTSGILLGFGSGISLRTGSGIFLGFGKGGGGLTIRGPTLLSLEVKCCMKDENTSHVKYSVSGR